MALWCVLIISKYMEALISYFVTRCKLHFKNAGTVLS